MGDEDKFRKFPYDVAEFSPGFARLFMTVVADKPPHQMTQEQIADLPNAEILSRVAAFDADVDNDFDWMKHLVTHLEDSSRFQSAVGWVAATRVYI